MYSGYQLESYQLINLRLQSHLEWLRSILTVGVKNVLIISTRLFFLLQLSSLLIKLYFLLSSTIRSLELIIGILSFASIVFSQKRKNDIFMSTLGNFLLKLNNAEGKLSISSFGQDLAVLSCPQAEKSHHQYLNLDSGCQVLINFALENGYLKSLILLLKLAFKANA